MSQPRARRIKHKGPIEAEAERPLPRAALAAAQSAPAAVAATTDAAPTPGSLEAQSAELLPAELPGAVPAGEALAVYLHWLLIGIACGSFALLYPVASGLNVLASLLPRWSQVCGAGAILLVLLALIERTKRDRKRVGLAFGLGAALLAGLALNEGLLQGQPVEPGWFAVLLGGLVGAAQLLFVEDWIAGQSGPRFRLLALGLRDCATLPWWFWFSKRALALRTRDRQWQSRLREQREREWVSRKSAEDLAEQLAAERRAAEDRKALALAAAEAAAAEQRAAEQRRSADEAIQRATEAEHARASVQLKLAQARATTEELNRHAEAAALERTRLRREQLEAECRFIEAASAAQAAAVAALECGVEAARAQALLEKIQDDLALSQDPAPRSQAYG